MADTKESIHTHVFRQRIKLDDKDLGLVGFEHDDEVDSVRIISWKRGVSDAVEFPIEAMPVIAELLLRAYETRTRPNRHSCFAFQKLPE